MSELDAQESAYAWTRLSAGRVRATEKMPYLSSSLFALVPVPSPGLGTFAVDKYWRMYFDPAKCLAWSIDEIAAVWIHEVNHVFRNHAQRFEVQNESIHHHEWNMSADASINSDLKSDGVVLPNPEIRVYADSVGVCSTWKVGKTSEELFKDLIGGGSSNEESDGDEDNENNAGASENDENKTPQDDEEIEESESSGDDGEKDQTEDNNDDVQPSEASEETDNDVSSTGGDSGSPELGETDSEDSDSSEESDGSSSGSPSDDASQDDSHGGEGYPSCGSGSDGMPQDYEIDFDDPEYPGLDEGRANIVKEKTAQDILNHEKSEPGKTPGNMVREASKILHPQADWKRLLAVKVRQRVANVVGKFDYSYKRPNRRYSQSDIIYPSLRGGHTPVIYIVIDTSGSMTPQDLARALSEIAGILKRHRGNVYILTCDSASNVEVQTVAKVSDVELLGGGGTDMRAGIEFAAESKPRPDIILTITDGYTPWPKEPYRSAKGAFYMALIVKPKAARRASTIENKVPTFFTTIVVED